MDVEVGEPARWPDAATASGVPEPPPATYRRCRGVVFRWLDGTVLVIPASGERAKVTGSGALVWMALDAPGALADMLERIETTWPGVGPVDPRTLVDAVDKLLAGGLIEEVPGEPAAN